jgi:nucleoid DNA-binding protein
MPKASKAVTRVDLYEAVYQKVGPSRTESSAFVELILQKITDCLEKGEMVKLSSFGSFIVRKKESASRAQSQNRHRGANLSATRGGVQVLCYHETADQRQVAR